MNSQSIPASLAIFLVLCSVAAWGGEPNQPPPGKHVYDHAALSRCSSPFKREVITDPQARAGQAVRFTGEAWFISMHDEIRTARGKNRFTVRLRLPQGGRFVTDLEAGGKGFLSRAPLEFSDLPADGSYAERTVELHLPGDLNVVSLRGGLPGELIVDRIEVEPVAGAATFEVASARTAKLVYAPGETAEVTVLLANYAGREQTARVRLVVERGIGDETVLAERELTLPADTRLQTVTLPLAALPKGGYQLRAEVLQGGQSVSAARDVFVVTDRALRAGQYGNFSIHQPYSAAEADANVAAFRRNFVTVTEIDFWAPCDMSQLVPPPGKERWWSGQTAQRFSTEQLRTCIAKAHEQGIRVLGYADYSVIFGFRGYDFGRRFPDCLDWRTQNDNGFVWLGFNSKDMGLDSDLRAEDDARTDVKVTGVSRTLHTNPNAFRWHADQMVASMKHFGWDGFRYDDPIDYDARQVDLQGREAPFNGWGLGEVIAYSRRRIEEAKPGALLGHNGDPMRASSDAMYVSDDPQRMDKQETAVMRRGGFMLQEGWSNYLMGPDAKATWKKWRDRNVTAGRAARRVDGDVCVITDIRDHAPSWRKSLITALLLAAGNHVAYSREADRSFLALASRYCDLIYGDELRWLSADDAAKVVQVDAGGRPVWWQEYVRCLPTAPGNRVYLVHLINPPADEAINDSQQPQPLKAVRVSLTPPQGWKPTRAWLVGTERHRPFVEAVVGQTRRNDGREEPYLERLCEPTGTPVAELLPLDGNTVTVPEVKLWGLAAIECAGPEADTTPSDVRPQFPAPRIPDVTAPIAADTASPWEFAKLHVRALAGGDRKQVVADPLAAEGRAVRLERSLSPRVQRNPGLNWGWVQPIPTGLYRVTAHVRAPQALTGKLTLQVSTAGEAHEQNKFPKFPKFERNHEWDLAAVPTDRYGTLTVEMKWEEMPHEAELRFASSSSGLLFQDVLVECLQIFDTERIKVWKDGWPAGATLAAHPGTNVWFAQGLYHDYYRLNTVLKDLPGPVTVDRAVHFKVGQHPTGFQDAAFPSAERLAQVDLVIIADVDLITFRVPERDRLRGWVEAGGRLLMLGGTYAFGSGDWHLSDLLAPLYPAEIPGRYDLQPVGVEKAVKLEPVGSLAQKIDWTKPPVVLWQHVMKAMPDATVHVTAGGHPVILTRPYGEGQVCFITAAPLGDAPAGATAFWDWPEWPRLMGAVLRDLRVGS